MRLVKDIVQNEGIAKGFYRGLSPNMAGNSISWALYFLWYSRLKAGLQAYYGSGNGLSYYDFLLASGVAGTGSILPNGLVCARLNKFPQGQ